VVESDSGAIEQMTGLLKFAFRGLYLRLRVEKVAEKNLNEFERGFEANRGIKMAGER